MLCISEAYAVMRCLSVSHVRGLCRNEKFIFKICSPSGSHTILVFRTKRHGNIPTVIH